MTTAELNRDIKKFAEKVKGMDKIGLAERKEFSRLYHADISFSRISRKSILRLVALNNRCNFIPKSKFGEQINILDRYVYYK